MLTYVVRRLPLAPFTTWAIAVLAFVIIQLRSGDHITERIAQMAMSGATVWQGR